MHDDDSPRRQALPDEQDQRIERAVLFQVFDVSPNQLTVPELVRRVAADPEDFGEKDSVLRAVHELVGAGLLRRSGEAVSATDAALRADVLIGEND